MTGVSSIAKAFPEMPGVSAKAKAIPEFPEFHK
jgi:hypothetical protein